MSRRSFSFELLANNSPGDGDSANLYGSDFMGDEKSDKPRRRRRKNRSRKTSVGDLSPISPIPDESGSHLSTLNSSLLPPLPYSVDSFAYPSDWPLGISPTESSPSVSAESPSVPLLITSRSLEREPSSLGVVREYRSGSSAGWDHRDSNQLDSLKLFASTGSELSCHAAKDDSRLRETLEETLGNIKEGSVTDSVVYTVDKVARVQGASERSLLKSPSFRENLSSGVPDFSAANGGIVEPSFAPGALFPPTELRQRLVERSVSKHNDDNCVEDMPTVVNSKQRSLIDSNLGTSSDEHATPPPQKIRLGTFATPQLKDWERLMAANNHPPPVELSPLQYIRGEVFGGSTLRNTNAAGSDQRREQVYNTMFHVPWRCELLIDVGFFVCLDAFLSLFTVIPARIIMYFWHHIRNLFKRRQFQRPVAAELCDFGCLIVLVVGVAVLRQADISIIYHWIRCQGIVKLYVIFNVLEVDTVERFHILTHVLFVWAQNVENAEESLWLKFFYNAGMVFFCEMIVDVIKHSFLAKFNEVKPATYSQFLQALCTQTLSSQSHEVHKTMAFVPLAPACVVCDENPVSCVCVMHPRRTLLVEMARYDAFRRRYICCSVPLENRHWFEFTNTR
ncbi:hypothetical protein AXG93_154s1080 [Marchantia polymorpha subsp. ruderalis]|uniref:Uncharacterized protein n=1 Tax=Marchantia polymorpha subsp. ruderalis TaxID=1480154 RepID=A0A176VI95_MARPO|nr:hypothetical protein AXG93_154s1080 [Marchantia polymorpha subsp. ruderalis]